MGGVGCAHGFAVTEPDSVYMLILLYVYNPVLNEVWSAAEAVTLTTLLALL